MGTRTERILGSADIPSDNRASIGGGTRSREKIPFMVDLQ